METVDVLCCHSFAYHTLHSGETDAVLVLKQLADCTDTTVSKMIDIVFYADAVLKVHIVVDGSKDIFLRDALRNELVDVAVEFCF